MFPFRDQGGFSGSYSLFSDDPLNLPEENGHTGVADALGLHLGESEHHTQPLPSLFPTQQDLYTGGDLAAPMPSDQCYGAAGNSSSSAACLWDPTGVPSSSGSDSHFHEPSMLAPYSYGGSYDNSMATPCAAIGTWGATNEQTQNEASLGVDPYQQVLPGTSNAAQPLAPEEPIRRRKPKMYQMGPQDDAELEKKRLRAIKQYKKRQMAEQHERSLNISLNRITQQVTNLRLEKQKCQQVVSNLEEELGRTSSRPAPLSDQQGFLGKYTNYTLLLIHYRSLM